MQVVKRSYYQRELPRKILRRFVYNEQLQFISGLCKRSLQDISNALDNGEVSAVDVTNACIKQIDATRHLNMFVWTDHERSLALARESDERRKNGKSRGPIDGIPIAVKDLYCEKDVPTEACSKILEGFVSPYESTATANLLNHGAIPMGKLNMDEFAMGGATINTHHGPCVNPWSENVTDQSVTAGGSSGGSAVAVATGCCFAALGSDTGGSIRQPAAYCGIVGFKPTYGLVSRHGMISYASSLDTPGVFARSVRDAAIILNVISSPDLKDSTCLPEDIRTEILTPPVSNSKKANLAGMRIGVPHEYFVEELPEDILDVWDQGISWLRESGAQVVSVSLPYTKLCIPAYYIIACAEASSNLSRYDGVRYGYRAGSNSDVSSSDPSSALHDLYCRTRSEGFGEEVQRRLLSGTFVLSAGAVTDYYERAVLIRQRIRKDFEKVLENTEHRIDALLTPTTPSGPPLISHFTELTEQDPVAMYLNDVMTIPANMAGLPAISVPVALTKDGLPLGLQLMSGHLQENKLLHIATALEQHAAFHTVIPNRVYC